MADETLNPKRQPVKAEENPPAPLPPTHPPLKFIEDTLGAPLDDEQRGCYEAGYWDDDAKRGPLTASDIRIYERARLEARRQMEASRRLRQIKAEQARSADTARKAADPAAITCTRCKGQFEFLRTQPFKMCGQCQWADVEERQAKWDADQQAEKDALAARIAASRENWTTEQWDNLRREARAHMEGPALRRARRRLWLRDHIKKARELRERLYGNPAAKERCERLSAAVEMWEERQRTWREGYEAASDRYWNILAADERRRNIHPAYRYCHNDGLPIPWDRNAFFCDDLCQKAHEARGEEKVDVGTRCVCGALLITDDQPLIDALPVNDMGETFHTWECLMSDPTIDVDDYTAFGPDAACWKPLLHVALVKPAHTFKERQKQIMRSSEKVLAMTGGPTAKLMLENPAQAAALLAQWMPHALPAAPAKALPAPRVLALGPAREQTEADRVLDFIATAVKDADGYVSLMQVRRGPARIGTRWISNTAARAALDRLTADQQIVKHPTENRWRRV